MFGINSRIALIAIPALLLSCAPDTRTPAPHARAPLCVNGRITWKIDSLEDNGLFNVEVPNADYRIGSGVRQSDVPWLRVRFGVHATPELVGKTFSASCTEDARGMLTPDPGDLLDRMAINAMHDELYARPTDDELYDRLVDALVHLREPALSDLLEIDVSEGYGNLYAGSQTGFLMSRPDPALVRRLTRDIARRSGGALRLSVLTADDMKYQRSRCACMGYFALTDRNGHVERFAFGPYANPVTYDRENPGHA